MEISRPKSDFWFACVDIAVIKDEKLSPCDKAIYMTLCAHADVRTRKTPLSVKKLADETGCGIRTAQKSIKTLIERGVLERREQYKDGRQLTSSYRLACALSEIGVPRRHLECLANHRDSLSLRAALEWTCRRFLMLCGDSGTGKSFTAVCLLRKNLSSRIPDCMDRHTWREAEHICAGTAWINASELYGDREAIATARTAHLLVLDDFGGDGEMKANHSTINRVISTRYDVSVK
jgi:DNA replication protein DnaC